MLSGVVADIVGYVGYAWPRVVGVTVEIVERNYAKGMLRGLARLHAQELLHLDLKPDNLFVMPDGGIKIGDFGCAPRQRARRHCLRLL